MKLIFSMIVIAVVSSGLIACSTAGWNNQPYEQKDIDDYTDEELTGYKKPIGSKKKAVEQTPTITYTPSNTGTLTPLVRKEGVLSFEEWKKAKETNSKEYQEYLEYREYLQTLQSQ